MCFEWGFGVVVGEKAAEEAAAGKTGGGRQAGMARADLWDKAVAEASEMGFRGGLKSRHTSDLAAGSGVEGRVGASVLGVDGHEEFSAAAESGSQAESWLGERTSIRRMVPRWQC